VTEGGGLRAVVFDVDGTLADTERHGHRVAFNRAFEDLELPYHWDEETYGELLHVTGGKRRLAGYLAAQGVDEPERDRLAGELHRRKTAIMKVLVDDGVVEVRPGARRLLDELTDRGCALAVATTGSRDWVERLLERLLPGITWDVIVTGDEVENRKPHPEAYAVACHRLGTVEGVVAVEDSGEGVESAVAAGLPCVVVVNGYTAGHDLGGAALVLDGFGEPGRPATVVEDRVGAGCAGVLDAAVLERVAERPPAEVQRPTAR
jgi:HAD superfamily hydrolase (TIGR01509 family)